MAFLVTGTFGFFWLALWLWATSRLQVGSTNADRTSDRVPWRRLYPYAFSAWFAGAGVKGGRVFGSTDEFGLRPLEHPIVSHDINATILRLLGLDHTKLTYFYQGRDQRLTDVHGENEFTRQLLV